MGVKRIGTLHTWTRALVYHPHVHMLVTAGGVRDGDDGWITPKRSRFFVPGYALSVIFRAKFKDGLRRAGLLPLAPRKVWDKDWVVHLQHAGDGERALAYLARYVFKAALVNSRLEGYEGGRVTFRYRDNRTRQIKRCALDVHEFIARFLQHVLPGGFTKVRSYGLFAPSNAGKLQRAREALPPRQPAGPHGASEPDPNGVDTIATPRAPGEAPARRCGACEVGTMRMVQVLPRSSRSPP